MVDNIKNASSKLNTSKVNTQSSEQKDFDAFVSKVPENPRISDKYGFFPAPYTSLKDDLKNKTPVLRFGRLLFVVSKSSKFPYPIEKIKADVKATLKKMASIQTGNQILSTAKEKGMPVLIELKDGNDEKKGQHVFTRVDTCDTKVSNYSLNMNCLYSANYDKIDWYPYTATEFKNPNGSTTKLPSWRGLLHELGHEKDANDERNLSLRNKIGYPYNTTGLAREQDHRGRTVDPSGVNQEEKRNLPFEQKAMREAGLIPRSRYDAPHEFRDVKSPLEIPK